MQESKDIQPGTKADGAADSCGLMQESKDIQPRNTLYDKIAVVV